MPGWSAVAPVSGLAPVVADPVIVVGGGQAAVQFCLALRKEKVESPILLLSDESEYPYHRPPLSKSYLSGDTDEEKLSMRPVSFYESKNVEVQLDTAVTTIETKNKTVTTAGSTYSYQSLVIATGARPRSLSMPGMNLDGVHLLRDLTHSRKIKSALAHAKNIVVVGAGFIGLELASVARGMKKHVTVFDTADRVMARAVSPDVSRWFENTHRKNGIELRLNDSVRAIEGESNVQRVITESGDVIDCDLLVVGIGVIPNIELADAAGIACNNGIIVNEFCETTSEASVYAIGDCTVHPNPFFNNQKIRLESVQNATDQARVAAAAIAGNKKPYNSVPWFWSDQGEHSLQMAGLSDGADLFVRRAPRLLAAQSPELTTENAADSFSIFHFLDGNLQCVDSVNSPRDHMLARKLIAGGINPTPQQVADSDFDLKSLI